MSKVTVDSQMIKEAIAGLERKDEALSKLASANQELEILYDVIDLVKEGSIDPLLIREKVEAFLADPDDLRIFKKAASLRANGLGKLASGPDSSNYTSGETAEDRLSSNISNILNNSY